MKIRIKGNTIRLRLTRPEVEYFGKEKNLEDAVDFGENKLFYALCSRMEAKVLTAEFKENRISLVIPDEVADEWCNTQRVGVESTIDLPNKSKLYILIEKDFKCLDNTIEDQSENYPNPLVQNQS